MGKVKIPNNIPAKQANLGELFGDIWASYNIDLTSNMGKVRVSPRLQTITTSITGYSSTTMVHPVAFVRNKANKSDDTYFAVCDQKIYKKGVSWTGSLVFVADALSNSPTTALSKLYSDAVNMDGTLVVSLQTNVAKLVSGTWTADWWTGKGGSALSSATPHPLCFGFTKELLIGDGKRIKSFVSNTVDNERLILSSEYEIVWIRSSNSAYWIGARHKYNGEAKVFMWDGYSDYVNGDYKIGSDITFAGVIKDEIPYTVNGNGQLLAFSGSGFTEVARFPIANEVKKRLNEGLDTYPININRNGMAVFEGKILIFISSGIEVSGSGTNYTFIENQLSGIWEYTKETGLYHKYSIVSGSYDFGSSTIKQAGALFPINKTYGFFAGAQAYSNYGSTERGVINYFPSTDSIAKMGYFITPQIYTSEVEEMWQKIYTLYKKLTNTGDFIQIKYRTYVDPILSFDSFGTWTSTTTFTTTATEFANVEVGDEIEIFSGIGAGLSANITAISSVGGTYTVTIDFTLTGASGTFAFRTANWVKLTSITDTVSKNKEITVGTNSNWIQFKVVMYSVSGGNSPELEKLLITSKSHLTAGG